MKIDISEIVKSVNKECVNTVEIEMNEFTSRLGTFQITRKSPFPIKIANQEDQSVFITGSVELEMKIPCGRCLADVSTPIHFDIDKSLQITDRVKISREKR